MATTQSTAETTLHLTRTFKASAKQVFEARTRPEIMSRWMAPDPQMSCEVTGEAKLGGEYRVVMTMADGEKHIAFGAYKEFVPPKRLVLSWSWENSATRDTLITVDLEEKGGITEMRFTHSRFQNSSARDDHQKGWMGCFARLEQELA